jgi:DNA-binding beta-propeller fold protein YncE
MIALLKNRITFLLLLSCFGMACSTRYAMRSVQPSEALQWPYAPANPKVTYVQAFEGFERGSGGSASLLRAIAGSSDKKNDLFVLPVAIAKGSDGRIAVADQGRKCIHLFIPSKNKYVRLYGHDRDVLVSPVSVIFDDELRLYASDSTGKILVFKNDGSFAFAWRGAGQESFQRPTGLAYSPLKQLIYAVDTLRHKVYALRKDGSVAFSFGERGEGNGQFNFPTHIFRSATGSLYVSDSMNFRVQIFDESGKFEALFGHHGDGSGDLALPKGIAADKDGIIYVSDSLFDNLQLFDSKGTFLLTVGKRGVNLGEFWLPSGMFIDDANTLYVCDTYNHRVQVFQITEHYS